MGQSRTDGLSPLDQGLKRLLYNNRRQWNAVELYQRLYFLSLIQESRNANEIGELSLSDIQSLFVMGLEIMCNVCGG